MNKSEIRSSVASDLDAFFRSGGKVVVCKTVRRKVRMQASGFQKLSFGWAEPKARPSNAWDLIG